MPPPRDARLDFILSEQQHCDHYLSPLADPSGRSVLVAGCGAGTEMLWCLRRGAKEVVGVDLAPQDSTALERAARQFEIAPEARFSIHQLPIEDVGALGRKFDLVLSNNVFEHVSRLEAALTACLRALEPRWGRLVIFSAPLFYSSSGSHLVHEPWEHLWADGEVAAPAAARARRVHASGARADAARALPRHRDHAQPPAALRVPRRGRSARRGRPQARHAAGPLHPPLRRVRAAHPRAARRADLDARPDDRRPVRRARTGDGGSEHRSGAVARPGRSRGDEPLRPRRARARPIASLEARILREGQRSDLLLAKYHEVLGLLRAVETSPTFRAARLFSTRLKRLARW